MQLPVPPSSFHGSMASSVADKTGVIWYTTFSGGAQRVYKLVNGVPQEQPLEHLCTARGGFSVEPSGLYLTGWDDHATGLWRIGPIKDFVPAPWPSTTASDPRIVRILDALRVIVRTLAGLPI